MTTAYQLQLCFFTSASHTLLDHPQQLAVLRAFVGSGRSTLLGGSGSGLRRRRTHSSPFTAHRQHIHRRRSLTTLVCTADTLQRVAHSFARERKIRQDTPTEYLQEEEEEDTISWADFKDDSGNMAELMPPPPRPNAAKKHASATEHAPETAQTYTPLTMSPVKPDNDNAQWASLDDPTVIATPLSARASNRLSLTLPIMPATSTSARSSATPISASQSSMPPTPVATPASESPIDPNDMILAIAAQERKVLELREELKAAETDLTKLKRQWGKFDTIRKRNALVKGERISEKHFEIPGEAGSGSSGAGTATDKASKRRSLILGLGQQQQTPGTPQTSRRRVIRGGHARTLSLLSPTKTDADFSVLEDQLRSPTRETPDESIASEPVTSPLAKRASWQPRSANTAQALGMKQMAEDIKAGLWTFVEDLRQATVGDEPINGSTGSPAHGHRRTNTTSGYFENRATSSPGSQAQTGRHGGTAHATPTPASRFAEPLQTSNNVANARSTPLRPPTSKRNKQFTVKPLTVDTFDDADWSNWDSPTGASPRWSGSTIASDAAAAAAAGSSAANVEGPDENGVDRTTSPTANRLEELSLNVLNTLSPSNLKKATSELLTNWEKSLAEPVNSDGVAASSTAHEPTT